MPITTEPDTRFRTYLRAFFKDMLTGMSGPLSVPFAALAIWVSSRTQKVLWGCLAAVCAMFASYRVWRYERENASNQISSKEDELSEVRERLRSIETKRNAELRLRVGVSGEPPSQQIQIEANRNVALSRIDYLLTSEAAIAGEDVSQEGASLTIPVNDALVLKVWNTPRPDRNHYDHSGPAKIALTISAGDQPHQFILPVQMDAVMKNNTMYRKLTGSKMFASGN